MTAFCTCPTCGQPLPKARADLAVLAGLRLGRVEMRALGAMVRAYPRAVTHGALLEALYGDDPSGGPLLADDVVRTVMRRLREKLKPFGWTIPREVGGKGIRADRRLLPLEA